MTHLMTRYPKADTIFVNASSLTMTELLRVIERLSETQIERELRRALRARERGAGWR